MKPIRTLAGVACITLSLIGCAAQTTSAERHARHFVYQSLDDFDPNFRTLTYNSTKTFIPFFQQFYDLGKKDKADGMTPAEMAQRIDYFHSDAFFANIENASSYFGHKSQEQKTAKWRKAMENAISETYRDGYDGRE